MLGRVDLWLHTNCFCSLQEILSKVNSLIVSMGQSPILNLFLTYHLVLLRTLAPWQAVLFIWGSNPLRPQIVTLGSVDATLQLPTGLITAAMESQDRLWNHGTCQLWKTSPKVLGWARPCELGAALSFFTLLTCTMFELRIRPSNGLNWCMEIQWSPAR